MASTSSNLDKHRCRRGHSPRRRRSLKSATGKAKAPPTGFGLASGMATRAGDADPCGPILGRPRPCFGPWPNIASSHTLPRSGPEDQKLQRHAYARLDRLSRHPTRSPTHRGPPAKLAVGIALSDAAPCNELNSEEQGRRAAGEAPKRATWRSRACVRLGATSQTCARSLKGRACATYATRCAGLETFRSRLRSEPPGDPECQRDRPKFGRHRAKFGRCRSKSNRARSTLTRM